MTSVNQLKSQFWNGFRRGAQTGESVRRPGYVDGGEQANDEFTESGRSSRTALDRAHEALARAAEQDADSEARLNDPARREATRRAQEYADSVRTKPPTSTREKPDDRRSLTAFERFEAAQQVVTKSHLESRLVDFAEMVGSEFGDIDRDERQRVSTRFRKTEADITDIFQRLSAIEAGLLRGGPE